MFLGLEFIVGDLLIGDERGQPRPAALHPEGEGGGEQDRIVEKGEDVCREGRMEER